MFSRLFHSRSVKHGKWPRSPSGCPAESQNGWFIHSSKSLLMAINGGRRSGRRIKSGLNVEIFTGRCSDRWHVARITARGVRGFKAMARHAGPAFRIVLLGACVPVGWGLARFTQWHCPGGIMASGIINETSATNLGQGVATRPAPFQMSEMFARIFTHRVEAFSHEYKYNIASCKQQPLSNQCVSERDKRKSTKRLIRCCRPLPFFFSGITFFCAIYDE